MKIKNIYVLLLSIFFFAGIVGCRDKNNTEDPVVRLQEKLEGTKAILTDAPNGWIIKMYPHADLKYGGFNVFVKFDKDGKVHATNDLLEDNSKLHESLYSLSGNDGASLTFDTYNRAVHMFSEPASSVFTDSRPYGADGDFVFNILEVSKDKIRIKGVRSGVETEMIPVPADVTWDDMLKKMKAVRNTMNLVKYKLSFSGKSYVNFSVSPFDRVISFEGIGEMPFRYTQNGIELFKPMDLGGEKVSVFTLKNGTANPTLASSSGNVTIERMEPTWPEKIVSGIWFTAMDYIPKYSWIVEFVQKLADGYAAGGGVWKNAKITWMFLGKYASTDGAGFGMWSHLLTDALEIDVYSPITPTIYDDKPDKITFLYEGKEKANTNSEYLSKQLVWNFLVYPFAHIGNKDKFSFKDTTGSRTFTVSVQQEESGDLPLILKLTEDKDPNNVIYLSNKMIEMPLISRTNNNGN